MASMRRTVNGALSKYATKLFENCQRNSNSVVLLL